MTSGDLPEGVIDADPPGGYSDGATADAETAEQNADAAGSPLLSDEGRDALDAGAAEAAAVPGDSPDAPVPADGPVESAELQAHMDADLSTENSEELLAEDDG